MTAQSTPMDSARRKAGYLRQTGRKTLTAKQQRRYDRKSDRASVREHEAT